MNTACLAINSVYLFWSIGAKIHVESVARVSLERQGIGHSMLLTTPTAFNTLLWRVLAMDNEGYAEGYYSLLDGNGGRFSFGLILRQGLYGPSEFNRRV